MGDSMMKPLRSRRADVLKRVLDYISAEDFEDGHSYPFMVFGKQAFEDWLEQRSGEPDSDDEAIRKIVSDAKAQRGAAVAHERTSLTTPLPKSLRGVEELSPGLVDAIRQLAAKGITVAKEQANQTESQVIEALDAHYANQVLEKLDGILGLVRDFDPFEPRIREPRVRKYFEEAHHLYLYGFRVGAAVLCRAILDSALEDKVGARHKAISRKLKPGESANLLDAAEKGFLGKEKEEREGNLKAAAWVREAGNCAIHELSKFDSDYADHKIAEVLSLTRGLLSKMYATTS